VIFFHSTPFFFNFPFHKPQHNVIIILNHQATVLHYKRFSNRLRTLFEVFTAIRSSTGSLFELNAFLAGSLSCVFGLLISFFGFVARKAVSATAFTVTGVVNKFLTVAINVTIWDKHASPAGLVCLLFTIVGGVLYQQSVTGNVLQQRDAVVVTKQTDVESSLVGDSDDESEGKGKHASL
jgi:GDP-mannose transporter